MDYALIFFFQIVGIAFHVMPKLVELDKIAVDDSFGDVWRIFWKQDKFTLLISLVIIIFNEGVHFCMETYAKEFTDSISQKYINFHIVSFGIAFMLGYAGQRILYSAMGKAEIFITKKIEDKLT